jgi:hypothetical protein
LGGDGRRHKLASRFQLELALLGAYVGAEKQLTGLPCALRFSLSDPFRIRQRSYREIVGGQGVRINIDVREKEWRCRNQLQGTSNRACWLAYLRLSNLSGNLPETALGSPPMWTAFRILLLGLASFLLES